MRSVALVFKRRTYYLRVRTQVFLVSGGRLEDRLNIQRRRFYEETNKDYQ
jgi:hypothetical protein